MRLGTHNETEKNLALFSSITNGIMVESRLRIFEQFFNRIENSITFTQYQSHNLIGTEGIAKFGPKYCQVFKSNMMSLKRHHQVKEHRETRDSS